MNDTYICPYCGFTAKGGMTWQPGMHYCHKVCSHVGLSPIDQFRQHISDSNGTHRDGSITLSPRSAEALRELFRWGTRDNRWAAEGHIKRIETLKRTIWEEQGLDFEVLT